MVRNDIGEKAEVLCSKIEEEVEVCRKLIELTEEEQRFLVKDDIENLERNTEEMKVILQALRSCQQIRKKLMEEMGKALKISGKKLTVAKIAERLGDEVARKLKEKSKELVKTGEKLYKVNRNTLYLVGFSLELLEQQSRLWAELLSDQEGYGEDGKRKEAVSSSLFVQGRV